LNKKNLKMKKLVGLLVIVFAMQASAQSNTTLLSHYEAYYKQMKKQGDVQGVIDALTHLNVLAPNERRLDTLAVLYMNEGRHIQALNTIGIEKKASDSDMAVEVKAVCLHELNQPKRALEHYEEMFRRNPNPLVAYEMADIKIQLDNLTGANLNITYGIANSKADILRTFYESQQPYQVKMKAAFLYLKALSKFKENMEANIDSAIAILDEALAIEPNFNLALISKEALSARKAQPKKN
jgi:tetratricopeptide (TPR) repeat protein